MRKVQVNAMVAEAIDNLMKAQPGRPSSERQAFRQKANEILAQLTIVDLRKIDDELVHMLNLFA